LVTDGTFPDFREASEGKQAVNDKGVCDVEVTIGEVSFFEVLF